MADPRRSARSTKGVNPRLTEPEPSPAPAKRRKSTPAQKSQSPAPSRKKTDDESVEPGNPEEEQAQDDAIIRCVCGQTTEIEDDDRMMIQCDGCTAWQHTQCMAIPKKKIPPQYFCEVCRPDLHEWLLEEMGHGEKPWEMKNAGKRKAAWERRRHEAEEKKKRQGSEVSGAPSAEKKKTPAKKVEKKETPQPEQEQVDREATIPAEETPAPAPPPPPPPPPAQEKPKAKPPSTPQPPPKQPNIELKNGKSLAPIVTQAPEPAKKTPKDVPTPKSVKRKSSEDSDGEYKEEDQGPQPKVRKVSIPTRSPTVESPHPKTPAPAEHVRRRSVVAPKPIPQKKHSPKDDVSPQTELVNTISELRSHSRRQIVEWLVSNSILNLAKTLASDGKITLAKDETVESLSEKKALEIEHHVYMNHFDGGQLTEEYRKRMKTINFNCKSNVALTEDVLAGRLSGEQVSHMSTEELASKKIQEANEQARLESDKQHTILTEQQGPRIRRTHKGEELVEDVSTITHSTTVDTAPTVVHHRRPVTDDPEILEDAPALDRPQSTTPAGPSTTPPTTSATHTPRAGSPSQPEAPKEPRKSFDINSVWAKVETTDQPSRPASTPQIYRPQTHHGVKEDHDVDMLLQDDSNTSRHNDTGTPPYSPQLHPAQLPHITPAPSSPHWKGHISMNGIAALTCYATHLGGPASVATKIWPDLLDPTFAVDGRIKVERATEYLCGQKFSRSSALITALLQPETDQDKAEFEKLWEYFENKDRYAVVGKHGKGWIKDLYLVPVEKGRKRLPDWFEVLDPPVDATKLPDGRALLIVTVVIRQSVEQDFNGPPQQPQPQPQPQFQTPVHQQHQWPPHLQQPQQGYGTPLQPVTTPYSHPTPVPGREFNQQQPPPPQQPQFTQGYQPVHPMTRELIGMVPGLGEVQIRAIDLLLQTNPELQDNPNMLAEEVEKVLEQSKDGGGQGQQQQQQQQ